MAGTRWRRGLATVLLSTALMGSIVGHALADTTVKLTEVITSPERTALLRKLLDKFESENPGIKVEVTSLPWGQSFEKLATMVQGGDVPDVVEMPERWLALYANNDQLADLTQRVAKWPDKADLAPAVLNYGTLGGKTWMMPYGFYLRAMFWNKKLFKEAGLDHAPRTLDEFTAAAKKISALGNGKYGYCLRGGVGGANIYLMMMQIAAGSNQFFDKDGDWLLDKPEAVKGLQTLVDIYQSGGAPKDSVNWGFNEIVAGFYSGTCAMLDQDPDALIGIKDRMAVEDFAVAPMPVGPAGKSFPTLGYTGWAMFKASEVQDDAWKLIAFLESAPSNLEWSKFVGVIPIHQSAQKDSFFNTEQFKGWFTELNDPEHYVPTPVPAYLEQYGFWSDQISLQTGQEALLGQRSAQDVADEWGDYFTKAQQAWLAKQ